MAIATGQASLTEQQRADWTRIQTGLTELAVQINRHPALAGLSAVDRYALDRAATKAAKETAEKAAELATEKAAEEAADQAAELAAK